MAKDEFTLESWLKDLDLSEDEMRIVSPLFSKPERTEKLKGSVLRQSEFSRKMNDLDKQKAELEASILEKEQLIAADAQKLGAWKQTADKTLTDTAEALEKERVERFKLAQKMERLATQYGEDPKQWLSTEDVTPPPKEPVKAVDTSEYDKKYFSREDADKFGNELRLVPDLAAEFHDLAEEHYELFGKRLKMGPLVQEARKSKKLLREQWAEQYKVEERRKELSEKAIEERIQARVSEEKQKILSEHKLPVTRSGDGDGSPLLQMREDLRLAGKERKSQGSSAVDAAVKAYNTGKYKEAAVQ